MPTTTTSPPAPTAANTLYSTPNTSTYAGSAATNVTLLLLLKPWLLTSTPLGTPFTLTHPVLTCAWSVDHATFLSPGLASQSPVFRSSLPYNPPHCPSYAPSSKPCGIFNLSTPPHIFLCLAPPIVETIPESSWPSSPHIPACRYLLVWFFLLLSSPLPPLHQHLLHL